MSYFLECGYSRKRFEGRKQFIQLDFNDVMGLRPGDVIPVVCIDGKVRECRVNGKIKTWKTRPFDLELPLKYGLKECTRLKMINGRWQSEVKPLREISVNACWTNVIS